MGLSQNRVPQSVIVYHHVGHQKCYVVVPIMLFSDPFPADNSPKSTARLHTHGAASPLLLLMPGSFPRWWLGLTRMIYGGFQKWGCPWVPHNGWFIMENPIKMDDD